MFDVPGSIARQDKKKGKGAFEKKKRCAWSAAQAPELPYFFFAPSTLSVFFTILPSMTTPLPSKNAMRERPSQFLNVSTTSGCCGAKFTSAISFDLSECGSSIFLPPVSLPIFQFIFAMRHAERPQRTKPIGE